MATTGRPKTPTKLALLKGEQPSRINHGEPQPDLRVEVPHGVELGAYGQWEWDRIVGDLVNKGVATGWDVQTLAAWCKACEDHWRAAEVIQEDGMIVEEEVLARGEVVGWRKKLHPAWKSYESSLNAMMKLSARFGFTPSDRAGISVAPTEKQGTGEDLLTG